MNEEYIRGSIEPKSDQLNADDLMAGPMTVVVRQVKQGPSKEQPVEIVLDGHRPYRPCKSMRRVLVACWGDKGSEWIGRAMTLYNDPNVRFGGVAVGGVRISHLSNIDGEQKLMLTTTRSKRAPYIVLPLDGMPAAYPDDEFIEHVGAWVKAIKEGKITTPEVIKRASAKGMLTSEQIEELERLVNEQPSDNINLSEGVN